MTSLRLDHFPYRLVLLSSLLLHVIDSLDLLIQSVDEVRRDTDVSQSRGSFEALIGGSGRHLDSSLVVCHFSFPTSLLAPELCLFSHDILILFILLDETLIHPVELLLAPVSKLLL